MRRLIVCGVMLLSAMFVLPVTSAGQQKNKQKKDTVTKEETTAQDYSNLAQVKEIVGKIAELDLKEGTMTFTIEWSRVEPNPDAKNPPKMNQKAVQLQQQVMRDYNTAVATKNPIHRQQALARFQQHLQQLQAAGNAYLQNMFRVAKSTKDFTVTVMDNVKVARAQLEQKYTDEGEIIKYTPAELKKMKSADMPSGYTASPEDLKIGQSVNLYLSSPKKPAAKKADVDSGTGSDAKDKVTDSTIPADRPQVRMVLIMEEAAVPEVPDLPKKKKKNG